MHWIFCDFFQFLLEERQEFPWLIPRHVAYLSEHPASCWSLFVRTHCAFTKRHSASGQHLRLILEVGVKKCRNASYLCLRGAVFLTVRDCMKFFTCFGWVTNRSSEGLLVGSSYARNRGDGPRSSCFGWWLDLSLSRSMDCFISKIQRTGVQHLHVLWTGTGNTWDVLGNRSL